MFGRPAYLIGRPVFTIYNGAQTWSSLEMRKRVFLNAFPDLLQLYKRNGWVGEPLVAAQLQGARWAEGVMVEMWRQPERGDSRRMLKYACSYAGQKGVFGALWRGFLRSDAGFYSRMINRFRAFVRRSLIYIFEQCRPARWIRKFLS